MRALTAIALAGSWTSLASAQPLTLHINADQSTVQIGESITWTLTVTGVSVSEFFQAYDINLLASDDALGQAGPFETAMSLIVNPTPGTASGASLLGVSGGQSNLLDPLGVVAGSPIVLGSFSVVASKQGALSYSVEDGGVFDIDTFKLQNWCFCPAAYQGPPHFIIADQVRIVPATSSSFAFAAGALVATRRRRPYRTEQSALEPRPPMQ